MRQTDEQLIDTSVLGQIRSDQIRTWQRDELKLKPDVVALWLRPVCDWLNDVQVLDALFGIFAATPDVFRWETLGNI